MSDRVRSGRRQIEDLDVRPSRGWYALAALCATGIGMMLIEHPVPRAATTTSPQAGTGAATPIAASFTNAESGPIEIGPPRPPPARPSEPAAFMPPARPPPKIAPSETPPPGSFYVDEPLRYVATADGEAWRAATAKKATACVETIGTGDCAIDSMRLSCTLDRHGLLHCPRVTAWTRAGQTCAAPQALEECVIRAASGVFAKPRFERADVQLAEMTYWIRQAR